MLVNSRNVVVRTLSILLACCWSMGSFARQAPNIVLIVADDVGYSDFGAFGGEIDTPNIDKLAAEGIRFSNFHTASSCAPTRAMLMTGVDNHIAGIGSMVEIMPLSHRGKPGYKGVLNDCVDTIASLVRANGYHTSVAGKWHLGYGESNLPPARGFDQSVIQADSGSDNFEMRPYLPMKPEAYWFENGERMTSLTEDFYSSAFFVDKTIEYIGHAQEQGKPFFAYVAFQANHTPLQAPASFVDNYRGRYTEGWARVHERRLDKLRDIGLISKTAQPGELFSQDEWDGLSEEEQYFEARRMQAYAGMATAMDYEIGRLVAYLRDNGLYEDTVFLIFSDNGAVATEPYDSAPVRYWLERRYTREVETLGEKGSWVAAGRRWGLVSNTPLSGYKFYAWEGGVRVPLILSGPPSAVVPGELHHDFVYVTDLAPTILEIAGVDPLQARQKMTGRSLIGLIDSGRASSQGSREAIGYEFSGNSALYSGDYKIVRGQPPEGDRRWRLYNISEDPGETIELSNRMPELFEKLQQEYAAYVENTGVLPMPENYTVEKQAIINAAVFFYAPMYLPYLFGVLALVLVFYAIRRHRCAAY